MKNRYALKRLKKALLPLIPVVMSETLLLVTLDFIEFA